MMTLMSEHIKHELLLMTHLIMQFCIADVNLSGFTSRPQNTGSHLSYHWLLFYNGHIDYFSIQLNFI